MSNFVDLVVLKPLEIGRIVNSFDFGFSLGREWSIDEMEIELMEDRIWPFFDLLL